MPQWKKAILWIFPVGISQLRPWTQVAVEAADDTPRRAIRAMSCLKNWTMRRWIAIRNGENQWKWVKWGMALNNLRPYMIIDVL